MFAPLATEEFSVGWPINIPWEKIMDLTDLCLNNTVMITQCKCKPRVLAYLIIVPVKLIVICANCEYKFILTVMIDSHNPSIAPPSQNVGSFRINCTTIAILPAVDIRIFQKYDM